MKRILIGGALVLASILALPAVSAGAQGGRRAGRAGAGVAGAPEAAQGITPAEIQRMFDASALIQAQRQLDIRDEQFPQFLMRFKALQDIRRQALNERGRILQQIRQLLNAGQTLDETAVKDRLKALQDLDARQTADVNKAYDAIDQVLDLRQRAQFRLFEEVMERQKLQLITRARQAQANRQKP
jgi:hypothetical protein